MLNSSWASLMLPEEEYAERRVVLATMSGLGILSNSLRA